MKTETELKLTVELLDTRRQLIEAHAQIMQFQHRDIEAEIKVVQGSLDALRTDNARNE